MLSELSRPFQGYAPRERVPLFGYGAALLLYGVTLSLALRAAGRRGVRTSWSDVALTGVATHKLSRLVTKDFVTAPLRAPFTERRESEGAAEVHDEPRGGVVRRSVGYLLTCPYCLGVWISTGLTTSLVLRPTQTRFFLTMLASDTLSDFLHLGYSRLNEQRRRLAAERRMTEEIAAERSAPLEPSRVASQPNGAELEPNGAASEPSSATLW